MSWLRRLFGDLASPRRPSAQSYPPTPIAELHARCRDYEERLHQSEQKLRERSELLYELQQHYSSEHFGFAESMRNLKIERLRNAGMFADRDILIARAKQLQKRIGDLKERLRKYESVEDHISDLEPIVRENR